MKTKQQLINENAELRQKLAQFESITIDNSFVQESIRRQEKEFQNIFNSASIAIWYFDSEGRTLKANQSAASMLGLSLEDITGKLLTELFLAENAKRFIADLKEILVSGKPKIGVVEEFVLRSGEKRLAESDKFPYPGVASDVVGMIVLTRDITEQKKTQDLLCESEEMFRLFMEHNPIYVFFKDEDIRVVGQFEMQKSINAVIFKPNIPPCLFWLCNESMLFGKGNWNEIQLVSQVNGYISMRYSFHNWFSEGEKECCAPVRGQHRYLFFGRMFKKDFALCAGYRFEGYLPSVA